MLLEASAFHSSACFSYLISHCSIRWPRHSNHCWDLLDARAISQCSTDLHSGPPWYPTSNLWLSYLFSKIQAIYHFSFELSLNHKYWYTHRSPRDVSFWQVEMVSPHTPWCLPASHTEKILINVQGMSKWRVAACMMQKTHSIIGWQTE